MSCLKAKIHIRNDSLSLLDKNMTKKNPTQQSSRKRTLAGMTTVICGTSSIIQPSWKKETRLYYNVMQVHWIQVSFVHDEETWSDFEQLYQQRYNWDVNLSRHQLLFCFS